MQAITNQDIRQIALSASEFEHGPFAGADVLAAGTIVARHSTTGKFQIYAKGGPTNEDGIPKGVLTYAVTAAGAGDVSVSVLIAGVVNQDRLIIDADGDGSNIDGSVVDDLRDFGVNPQPVKQLGLLDNQ